MAHININVTQKFHPFAELGHPTVTGLKEAIIEGKARNVECEVPKMLPRKGNFHYYLELQKY